MPDDKQTGGVREYARHRKALGLRGGSHVAVLKLKKQGRLDGALRKDGLIDFAIADRLWEQNTRHATGPAPTTSDPDENFAKANLRKEIALADLRELEYEQKRAALIPLAQANAAWRDVVAIVHEETAKIADHSETIAADNDAGTVRLKMMTITDATLNRIADRFAARAAECAEGGEA